MKYALLFLLSFGTISCSNGEGDCKGVSEQANVLFVVVDTLRKDHLGVYGYSNNPTTPYLDSFIKEEGVLLDGLVGVSSWTMPSMATFFTGKSPAEHGVMRMMGEHSRLEDSQTLAALFKQEGWKTAGIQSNFLLQNRRRLGFNRGFDFWDDEAASQADPHRGSTADLVASKGLKWLQQQDDAEPWFLYLHFFDPHASYEDNSTVDFVDANYSSWVKGGLSNDELRANGPLANNDDRRQLANYYDEEIYAVDAAFAKVIEYLKSRDDWGDTVVVFTSDHGEELAERGYIGHTQTLHFEQTDLPFLVRLPDGAHGGHQVSNLLSQTDVAGTLLDLAGAARTDLPSFASVLHGKGSVSSCFGDLPVELEPLGYLGDSFVQTEVDFIPVRKDHQEKRVRKRAIVTDSARYSLDLESGEEALYYLSDDPLEKNNLAQDEKYLGLLNEMRTWMKQSTWWEQP